MIYITAMGTENGITVVRRAIESRGQTLEKFRTYHRIIRNMAKDEFKQFNVNLIDVRPGENRCRRAYRYIKRVDEANGFASDERIDKLIADAIATVQDVKHYAAQFKVLQRHATEWWCSPERIGCHVTERGGNYIKLHRITGVSPQGYRYRLEHIGSFSRHGDAYKWQGGKEAKLSVSVPRMSGPWGVWYRPLPGQTHIGNTRDKRINYNLVELCSNPTVRHLGATQNPIIASFPEYVQAIILSYLESINV